MAAVVGMVGMLVLVPLAVQLLATGQVTISQRGVEVQEALEAAHSGLADYIDRLEGPNGYLKYCSKGTFPCSSAGLTGVDAANPAFADTATANTWAYVHDTGDAAYQAYHYVVDTDGANPTATTPQAVTLYITGRAGAPHALGYIVYQTLRVSLLVTPGLIFANCATASQLTVPTGAISAQIMGDGAQGGASTGGLGGGGHGTQETAYPPVTPGDTLTVRPGCAGASGNFQLLNVDLGTLLFGNGGAGGGSGGTLDVGGGLGGSASLSLLAGVGGGGGAASVVCQGSSCLAADPLCAVSGTTLVPAQCVVAAGGGGGGDGGPSIGWVPGQGGYCCSSSPWSANGQAGTGLLGAGGVGGALGTNALPVGANGSAFIAALDGAGGGGGGGFPKGGGAGASGGILGIALGAGGGGGAGDSAAAPSCSGCQPASGTPVASYPATAGADGPDGVVVITFFGTGAGGGQAVLEYAATVQLVRPVPPNSTS